MATLLTLVDGTIPVAADFNTNFTNLNTETRPVNRGGTGLASYAVGDMLYASASTTIAQLAAVAKGRVILSQGATTAPVYSEIPTVNYLYNGAFEVWGSGTTSAPTGWSLAGAGATIARTTSDADRRIGTAYASVTRVGTDCYLSQNPATLTPDWPRLKWWQSRQVTFGCWVLATVASRARLAIYDGTTTTYSSYHTGGSAWEWLQVTATMGASATQVDCRGYVDTGNTTAHFDGATLVAGAGMSDSLPSLWRRSVSVLIFGSSVVGCNPATDLSWWTAGGAWSQDETSIYVPYACVLRNLYATSANGLGGGQPGAGLTFVYTVRKTGVNTLLTCTISGAASDNASDTTNEVVFAAGDQLDIGLVISGAGAANTYHRCSLEMERVPA